MLQDWWLTPPFCQCPPASVHHTPTSLAQQHVCTNRSKMVRATPKYKHYQAFPGFYVASILISVKITLDDYFTVSSIMMTNSNILLSCQCQNSCLHLPCICSPALRCSLTCQNMGKPWCRRAALHNQPKRMTELLALIHYWLELFSTLLNKMVVAVNTSPLMLRPYNGYWGSSQKLINSSRRWCHNIPRDPHGSDLCTYRHWIHEFLAKHVRCVGQLVHCHSTFLEGISYTQSEVINACQQLHVTKPYVEYGARLFILVRYTKVYQHQINEWNDMGSCDALFWSEHKQFHA